MLFLYAGVDAVDAAVFTKDMGALTFIRTHRLLPHTCAAIGDGIGDLPLLSIEGLGMVGAPSNAQSQVKEFVLNHPAGVLTDHEVLEGFLEFYETAKRNGISHIFADRDGVLKGHTSQRENYQELQNRIREMGSSQHPLIVILTGSGYEQNVEFISEAGLDSACLENAVCRSQPFLLLAENGAIAMNIATAEYRIVHDIAEHELRYLQEEFKPRLLERVGDSVLPRYGLRWSHSQSEQDSQIFLPPKRAMVTLNIPRSKNGNSRYRLSEEAVRLRADLLNVFVEIADNLGLPYRVIQ
jgi:predicted mannosyl-3-phosphoglycerate phosphatase (HAD superfamily)